MRASDLNMVRRHQGSAIVPLDILQEPIECQETRRQSRNPAHGTRGSSRFHVECGPSCRRLGAGRTCDEEIWLFGGDSRPARSPHGRRSERSSRRTAWWPPASPSPLRSASTFSKPAATPLTESWRSTPCSAWWNPAYERPRRRSLRHHLGCRDRDAVQRSGYLQQGLRTLASYRGPPGDSPSASTLGGRGQTSTTQHRKTRAIEGLAPWLRSL